MAQNEKQIYLNLYDSLKDFFRILEKYDQNLLRIYFNNENYSNLNFPENYFNDLFNKIKTPNNQIESGLYQKLYDYFIFINQKLSDNTFSLINDELLTLINQNNNKSVIEFGILKEKKQNCPSCFKIFDDKNNPTDSESVKLKYCQHNFCRGCLKDYVLKSTNNLVFLTRIDKANSRKRVLKCLNHECNFILFYEDYYNIFGEELINNINNNYNVRVKSIGSIYGEIDLNCLLCGTSNLEDCYLCPKTMNPRMIDCHCLCLDCCNKFYKSCKKINLERTIINQLPCPLPFCNANMITIKEKLQNIEVNKLMQVNNNDNQMTTEIIRNIPNNCTKLTTRPMTVIKRCFCDGIYYNLEFTHEPICEGGHFLHIRCLINELDLRLKNYSEENYFNILQCPLEDEETHYLKYKSVQSLLLYQKNDNLRKQLWELNIKKSDY